jgi:uncharacterized membrane protein YoaK (UPF0700 family)
MLYQSTKERTYKSNLALAGSTAIAAGMCNVAGALACFSFTANVTGHAASFAKHVVTNNWFELSIILLWLLMFFAGAFAANFLIKSFEHKGAYKAHALPLIIEILLMIFIGVHGISSFEETELYTEIVAAALLFGMGLQNSTVSTITGGTIKTSHLTGLFTDLGAEVSEWLHPKAERTEALKNKLKLRITILINYAMGGIIGGALFVQFNFTVFFIIAGILFFILCYDIIRINWDRHFAE